MKDITVEATLDNLEVVQNFVSEELENQGCSMKVMMQIEIAVEEIYVNIVHYAYNPEIGKATIRCEVTDEMLSLIDVLVDGRYVKALKDISLRFRGSSNQRLINMKKTLIEGKIIPWEE